ncbi:MAG TPA: DMT family transporter [Candidatus Eisenbacteria bacterium]|nr:DMT family transporter [Candidatus Eisenbacteria bacterium]
MLGEAAALGTALCWSFATLLFTRAARRVGAFTLNLTRITLALVILSLLVLFTRGIEWAPEAETRHVILLAVSGIVGLTLGDWAYFGAFVSIGPRVTTLFMTLAPPMSAAIAVPLLGEHLGGTALLGMTLTLLGVIFVVLDRKNAVIPRGHRIRGATLAVLGSLGQAVGLNLSKLGMGNVVDPLPATAIRMAAGTAGIWMVALALGRTGGVLRLAREPKARLWTLGATLLGPVSGIWLSLVAVRHTQTGIAATIMATTPILVLPLLVFIEKEHVSARAIVGTVIAVAGVALLFLT